MLIDYMTDEKFCKYIENISPKSAGIFGMQMALKEAAKRIKMYAEALHGPSIEKSLTDPEVMAKQYTSSTDTSYRAIIETLVEVRNQINNVIGILGPRGNNLECRFCDRSFVAEDEDDAYCSHKCQQSDIG